MTLYADQVRGLNKGTYKDVMRVVGKTSGYYFNGRSSPVASVHHSINARVNLVNIIEEKSVNNKIAFYEWGMDCDSVSSDSMNLYNASVYQIYKLIDNLYESAEGPVSWSLHKPDEIAEFKRSYRDHALEAFENGNAYSITY